MADLENTSDEAGVTGTVRAMFSESSDCICCEGPHRFSTAMDLDRRVSPYDSSNDIASFVFNRLHHMPQGARVRVTVEEVV